MTAAEENAYDEESTGNSGQCEVDGGGGGGRGSTAKVGAAPTGPRRKRARQRYERDGGLNEVTKK